MHTVVDPPPDTDDGLWTIKDVSAYLQVPKSTLQKWRQLGEGPPGRRLGRHLRYVPEDVHAWVLSQEG